MTGPVTAPLRFGLVGCGRVVRELHLPAWRTVDGARLAAVCDESPDALEQLAVPASVRRYRSLEALLDGERDLDFVVLATPGFTHVPLGEQILKQRLHLLCEKPLALDGTGAARLVSLAEASGLLLTPIFNYRYHQATRQARVERARPDFGDVTALGVRFRSGSLFDEPARWMRDEQRHRVLLFDLAIHFLDLALLFAGPVRAVRFVDAETDNLGLQYVVFGTEHDHGSRGLFELSLDAGSTSTQIEVQTDRGGFMLDFFPDGFRRLPRRDTPLHRTIAEVRRAADWLGGRLTERVGGRSPGATSHARLFTEFVAAVRAGGPNPVPPAEVLALTALLDDVAARSYGGVR